MLSNLKAASASGLGDSSSNSASAAPATAAPEDPGDEVAPSAETDDGQDPDDRSVRRRILKKSPPSHDGT